MSNCHNLVMDPAVLERVEVQRQALEDNVVQLRKSLRHWQSLELDYEGLKEEFELLPETASVEECQQTARGFNADVVDEKDLQDLMLDHKAGKRSPRQLADLLSKRIDYVSRNADVVRKQILAEEKKLNALLLVESPDHREEAGLPLTEITEELDESGNIISSKVERPGDGVSDLASVLEKAGVDGFVAKNGQIEVAKELASTKATVASSSKASAEAPKSEESVSDSEVDDEVQHNDLPIRVPIPGENPIPVVYRDTAEEAKLRREMLEYGLNEVGAIVAELDLQEDASDVSYDENEDAGLIVDSDLEDEDDDDDEDDDVSEDEFGRIKKPAISEKYKQKMDELQKKLGLTELENLGPTPELPEHVQEALNRPPAAEAARKAALAREKASSNESPSPIAGAKNGNRAKKTVAFAEDLDIAKEARHDTANQPSKNHVGNPMGEVVIERGENIENVPPPAPVPSTKKHISRFKSARQSAASSTATEPTTTDSPMSTESAINKKPAASWPQPEQAKDRPLIAPTVLERTNNETPSAPHLADIDDEMHRREIAMEYHKLRNRRIHEQGGFVRGDPDEDDELDDMLSNNVLEDPETGEVKRVSRFKAARLMR